MFEFYVLNYDSNAKKVINYNIFNNWVLDEACQKEIKKYLRSPKNYKRIKQYANKFTGSEEIVLRGWEAFVDEIKSLIMWQEYGRREYEISVGDAFITEISDVVKTLDNFTDLESLKNELEKLNNRNKTLEKWDCYKQCEPNIEIICHTIIRQYKEMIKSTKVY